MNNSLRLLVPRAFLNLLSVRRRDLLQQCWLAVGLVLTALPFATAVAGDDAATSAGRFSFEPVDENRVPAPFRLEARKDIEFLQTSVPTTASGFSISEIRFPSPVVTPHPANNTVHCEYFCPSGENKRPGVVVLHILGGDFELARLFCRGLATRGCSALFLKMPYYGPRREPGVAARMVSRDPHQTVLGMTQAVKDVRYAAAWLNCRPEIDSQQLGIMGISLGGITGALALTAEPRLQNACLLLAGGDVGKVAWESKELRELREGWEANGGTKETFMTLMKTVDPATYGENVRDRKVLMLNASHDEVVPPDCTRALWQAFGKPPIIWWDAGHYSAGRFIFDGLDKTTKFFASAPADSSRP